MKKEIQSLKVQRHNAKSDLNDEPTEELGSIISMNLDACDKENHPTAPVLSSSINNKNTDVNKRGLTPRVGLGANSGNIADDEPGECQQS